MLGALFQGILTKMVLSLAQTVVDVLKFGTSSLNFILEALVVVLVLFVIITLLGIQVIQFCLISVLNFLDLLFEGLDFVFHVTFLSKKAIKVALLLVVLILNVHEESFDIFWLRVRAMLIESQIVVSKLTFIAAHIFD